MLVNLFRHTQAISIFIVLTLCSLTWLGFYYEAQTLVLNPLYDYISSFTSNAVINRLAGTLIVFWQCILMNKIMVGQKVLSINSFFPALFYFLLLSFSPINIQLSSALIALTFILLSIKKLLSCYLEKDAYAKVFDTALFLSIACLIHPAFIVLSPLIWIGISIFSQGEWRHWVLSIIGFICPWVILYTISNFFKISELSPKHFLDFINVSHPTQNLLSWQNSISIIFISILGLFAIIELLNSLRRKNIKARKSYILFLWMLPLTAIYIFLSPENLFIKFSLLAIPLSAIISNYFYYHQKINWLNFLLISWGAITVFQFFI